MFSRNAYKIKRESVCAKFKFQFIACLIMGGMLVFANTAKAQVTVSIEEIIDAYAVVDDNMQIPILNLSSYELKPISMEVYPNPFTTELQVDLESESGAYLIEILDDNSNVIFESSISSLPAVFENINMTAGTYFLKIYTRTGVEAATIVKEGE